MHEHSSPQGRAGRQGRSLTPCGPPWRGEHQSAVQHQAGVGRCWVLHGADRGTTGAPALCKGFGYHQSSKLSGH